jgi:hypothetical protein
MSMAVVSHIYLITPKKKNGRFFGALSNFNDWLFAVPYFGFHQAHLQFTPFELGLHGLQVIIFALFL